MAAIDLLSMGDASLDVFLTPSESESFCQLDDKDALICFSYGDKIPVKYLEFSVGGNAANNAVGTRRLGVASSAILTLGDDNIGQQIVTKFQKEGVDTSFIVQQPATHSNYSTIINYSGERTILTYKAPRSYEWPVKLPTNVPWVYYTSMGDAFTAFQNHLVDWLTQNPDIRMGFNPGSRQLRAGLEAITPVMKRTSIIFVNRKEAEGLTNFKESQGKEKELLNALCSLGPKVSVITDGANGSFVYDGQRYVKAGVLPIDAHERTGAGDAFGSGCLSGIIRGRSLEEALLWGTLNSASVIGYTGSQRGLLKEADLPVWIERAKSSGVKVGEF
jgi:sugar/nucleoside kinase (ribokinase family)